MVSKLTIFFINSLVKNTPEICTENAKPNQTILEHLARLDSAAMEGLKNYSLSGRKLSIDVTSIISEGGFTLDSQR